MIDREKPIINNKRTSLIATTLRYAAFSLLGLVGIAIAIYITLLIFHLNKSEPNEAAQYFNSLKPETTSLKDADNAAPFIAKFDAFELQTNLEVDTGQRSRHARTLPAETAKQETLKLTCPPVVEKIKAACRDYSSRQCAEHIKSSFAQLVIWKNGQPEYLSRYTALMAKQQFQPAETYTLDTPIPPYQKNFDAQFLLHIQAAEIALNGDLPGATELLSNDFLFWKMLFKRSDILITKMIAAAGLRKHFLWVNLINSQHFQGDIQKESIYQITPHVWLKPFTAEEFSMDRILAGELRFVRNSIEKQGILFGTFDDPTPQEKVFDFLIKPMIDPQFYANQLALQFHDLCEIFEIPLHHYSDALEAAEELPSFNARADGLNINAWIYNNLTSFNQTPAKTYADYFIRIADVEGLRQAALAIHELRNSSTTATDANNKTIILKETPYQNHFTNTPFQWSENKQSLIYTSLNSNNTIEYIFVY